MWRPARGPFGWSGESCLSQNEPSSKDHARTAYSCSDPHTKPPPPFFSRLKIVLGSLGTDPGAGALPGFDGEGGGSPIAMRLAQPPQQDRLSILSMPTIDIYLSMFRREITRLQTPQLRWTLSAPNHSPQVLLFRPRSRRPFCPSNLTRARSMQTRKISRLHSHTAMAVAKPLRMRWPAPLPGSLPGATPARVGDQSNWVGARTLLLRPLGRSFGSSLEGRIPFNPVLTMP